jgi:hypothetical protein
LDRNTTAVAWVKPTAMEKNAQAEKKKKRKNKEKREKAGKKCMTDKLAKVSANDTAEQKKMEKSMDQAKRRALNKDKATTAKGGGAKKVQASKKAITSGGKKAAAEKTKPTRVPGKKSEKADEGAKGQK